MLPTNEEDPFKNEGARVVTTDLLSKPMQIFFDAQGKLTPQSKVGSTHIYVYIKLIQAFMVVLVTRKNEEDPIKIEGARVVTTLFNNF